MDFRDFLRDSAVDAEVIERSSQRLRQTPETRLQQRPQGMHFTSQRFTGRSVGLLGRLHHSGWDPTKFARAGIE
jgi:hypothetical protein